ncbi:MAG: hypothetical protein IJR83_04500, partial [Clostridia bacterium]|nr:hypothetical protein [Clostridia bacterium]
MNNPNRYAVSLKGERLYYTRELGNGRWEYGYMDLVSGSFSVLDKGVANGWTQFGVDVYTDNYRYWHEQIQENGELFYLVNRMNLQNGTVEAVKKTASTDIYGFYNTERCVVAVGDRIITADAHHLYSCDENLEDRKLLLDIETENLSIHEGEDCVYYWSMDPGAVKTITKLPLDGSSPEVIVRTAVVWTITSKYVYYLKNEGKDSEFSYYQKNGKTGTEPLRYTQMRRCCLDGSEDEFLMNLVTDIKIIRLSDLFPVGDYVYALARIFVTPDENGIYTLYSTGKEISTGGGNISTLVKIDV